MLTRVRIDDKSLRAAEGSLFSVEYIPPGCEFTGTIRLTDISMKKTILLLLSLAELRLGRIGRGGGPVDLMVEGVEELDGLLRDTPWLNLLNELKRWLWNEVP